MQWISLQKGPAVQQIAEIPPELRPIDACSQDRDLADTAAQIAPLDLVLTTDSAVAHLAAAMGKPLWLLLPWQSDWRWMQDRLRTPWYPQARLFRQSSPHNWPELISRIATELHSLQSTGHAIQ
jgi:ADP-heptose:LPS heptosyltransferase